MPEEATTAVTNAETTAARAYLYADPASHSLSPVMHAAAFAVARYPGTYQARRVTPGELPGALQALRAPGVLGANLSLPHKERAVPHLDLLSDAAREIGAVNTVINRQGTLVGDNTDAAGLLAALDDANAPAGPAVVLGAGGAARAGVWALRQQGRPVWVWNRTTDKARALAAEFGVFAAEMGELPWHEVRVLVNATSAGLGRPDELPLPALPRLTPDALVYDMVYRPLRTRLLREAAAAGYLTGNGLGMLAHQARLSFRAWTHHDVPAQVFLDAATRALD